MSQVKLSLTFKKATSTDVAFLLNLRINTMQEHLDMANIPMDKAKHLARIKEFFSDSFIIYEQKEPIGLIKLGLIDKNLHIRQFQILSAYQNKGIGTQVLNVVKKKARQLNRAITLNVLLKNPAQNLYIRNGFKTVSENELEYQMIFTEFKK